MREVLEPTKVQPQALKSIETFHPDVVNECKKAVAANEWVVIGMGGNMFVKKARKLLEGKGAKFTYLEHGNYLSQWKERLAIKLWSGWPTFPQVFHKGQLVGGYSELTTYLKN